MVLPIDETLKIGIQTIHREPDDQHGPWLPKIDELVEFVQHSLINLTRKPRKTPRTPHSPRE